MGKSGWYSSKASCRCDPVSYLIMTSFLLGLLTSCVNGVLSSTLHPIVQNILQSTFTPSPSKSSSILLLVASHLLTGPIPSPLDPVRTRLIPVILAKVLVLLRSVGRALADSPRRRGAERYLPPPTPLNPSHSGYRSPTTRVLTLPPYIATSVLGLHGNIDSSPFAWAVAELVGTCAGLIIVMPFETIRRRLQVQARGIAKPTKPSVEPRPLPYNRVVDAFRRIASAKSTAGTRRYPIVSGTFIPKSKPNVVRDGMRR